MMDWADVDGDDDLPPLIDEEEEEELPPEPEPELHFDPPYRVCLSPIVCSSWLEVA